MLSDFPGVRAERDDGLLTPPSREAIAHLEAALARLEREQTACNSTGRTPAIDARTHLAPSGTAP
jgi:hypothetical protein